MNEVEWLKKEWIKTAILYAIVIGGVIIFQLGLRAALRTQYPLAAVESGSMVPTLNIGDIIVVRGDQDMSKIEVDQKLEGDILVFYDPTGRVRPAYWYFLTARALIVHRAIEKKHVDDTWYFRTQGDHNAGPDHWPDKGGGVGWVPESYVVGKVVSRIPWLGRVTLFMQSDAGLMLIALLFVVMIMIDYVIPPVWESLKSEKRRI